MRIWRQASILLFVILFVISGCAQRTPSQASSTPNTDRTETSLQEQNSGNPDSKALTNAAMLYETYMQGSDTSGQTYNSLAYGWLRENGKLEQFTVEDTAELSPELIKSVNGLLLAKPLVAVPDETLLFAANYELEKRILLEPYEVTDDNASHVEVLFGRFAQGPDGRRDYLYPAWYTFQTYTLTAADIPEIASDIYREGDEVYLISNVKAESDKMWQIYSAHGAGDAFSTKTYSLSTPQDLRDMAERVNSGAHNEVTATYTLASDIDMTGEAFTPIGTYPPILRDDDPRNPNRLGYCGRFDGNGHTITGISFTGKPTFGSSHDSFGFFANIGPKAEILNLTLQDALISYEKNSKAFVSAGILAGSISCATLENCHVTGVVEGTSEVGGLVGSASTDFSIDLENPPRSIISGCSANAQVTGQSYIGGLVGSNHCTDLSNSYASGVVTAVMIDAENPSAACIGGLAGHNVWASISDSGCETQVRTMMVASCVGMVVGLNEGDVFSSFYNEDAGATWKGLGDSPREDLARDVTGVSRAEYQRRVAAMLPKERNQK